VDGGLLFDWKNLVPKIAFSDLAISPREDVIWGCTQLHSELSADLSNGLDWWKREGVVRLNSFIRKELQLLGRQNENDLDKSEWWSWNTDTKISV